MLPVCRGFSFDACSLSFVHEKSFLQDGQFSDGLEEAKWEPVKPLRRSSQSILDAKDHSSPTRLKIRDQQKLAASASTVTEFLLVFVPLRRKNRTFLLFQKQESRYFAETEIGST